MSTHTTENEILTEGDVSVEDEEDVVGPVRYDITSYGADYTADGLVKRLDDEHIVIPSFQRGYVWDVKRASKFIESLILGLPVPGIFLFKEEASKQLVVVDGQQRLKTLRYFFKGTIEEREKKFKLSLANEQLRNKTYENLDRADRRLLDDAILHATISQQIRPSDHKNSMYEIFNRLNTGGVRLSPQEIRSCVDRGSFNDLLNDLGKNPDWCEIYNPKGLKRDDRGKGEELILRFFALAYPWEEYTGTMSQYLDRYMEEGRKFDDRKQDGLRKSFERIASIAAKHIGPEAFRPVRKFNVSVLDALFVALSKRLERGGISNPDELRGVAESLLLNDEFKSHIDSRTTNTVSVKGRLAVAEEYFSKAS